MNRFSSEDLFGMVMKMVGGIEPLADTALDDYRYDNLIIFQALLDYMLSEIGKVAEYANDPFASRQRAGKQALGWLKRTREEFDDIISCIDKKEN